jgi:hypothetical protein
MFSANRGVIQGLIGINWHDRFKDEIELLTGRRVKEKGAPLGWRKEKK